MTHQAKQKVQPPHLQLSIDLSILILGIGFVSAAAAQFVLIDHHFNSSSLITGDVDVVVSVHTICRAQLTSPLRHGLGCAAIRVLSLGLNGCDPSQPIASENFRAAWNPPWFFKSHQGGDGL